VIEYRPGQRIWYIGEGVQIIHPRAEAGADWWDPNGDGLCIWAAYQPKGAANFAASLVDLSGNGNSAGDPGGASTPAWDAVNGWKFDGGDDYLTTTFVPQNDQTQSLLVQYTTLTDTGWLCGSRENGDYLFLRGDNGSAAVYRNGAASVAVGPALAAGNLGLAGAQGYRNGAAEGGAIGGWGGAAATSLYIAAIHQGAGVMFGSECAVYIQALAIYDCTLTAPQVAAVAAAMAAL